MSSHFVDQGAPRDPSDQSPERVIDPLPVGISVVVPCFNTSGTVDELVRRLGEVLPDCSESFEVILVNDGSGDDTWSRIETLARERPWLTGLNLMRNYGQHNATLCGVRAARYDVTVTLDDDLQNPPEEIPALLAKLAEGFDVVYGTPKRKSHSLFRNLASWLTRRAIVLATRQRAVKTLSAFRAFRTDLRRASTDCRSPEVLFDVLLAWGTARLTSVPVVHDLRPSGESNYGMIGLLRALLLLWTGYTTAPLRLASLLGFVFVAFGIAILAYVVGVYLFQGSLPGFPFLVSIIAIFGGVQLFTLGIMGEYLARLFTRSMDRPTYAVKASTDTAAGPRAEEPPRA